MKVGDVVNGKYELLELVGQGGMGIVYRVRCRDDAGADLPAGLEPGMEGALKVVHKHLLIEEDFVKRFDREAKNSLKVQGHPGIVSVFEFDRTEDQSPFLVMEFVDGETLSDLLTENPQGLELSQAYAIIRTVAFALSHMHGVKDKRGVRSPVVHRDLKPGNVVLTTDGEVKLLDFGIAKSDGTKLSRTGLVVGTPAYMSPEQWRGEVLDGRSDQYSLGLLAFALLTGRPPFHSETPSGYMHQHLSGRIPDARKLRRGIPRKVSKAVARALAKRRDGRFPSCAEFALEFPEPYRSRGPLRSRSRSSEPEANRAEPAPAKSGDSSDLPPTIPIRSSDAARPGASRFRLPAAILAVVVLVAGSVAIGVKYGTSVASGSRQTEAPQEAVVVPTVDLGPSASAQSILTITADTPVEVTISDSLTLSIDTGASFDQVLEPGSYLLQIRSRQFGSIAMSQRVVLAGGVRQPLDIRLSGRVQTARSQARMRNAINSFSPAARQVIQYSTSPTAEDLLFWDNFTSDTGDWALGRGEASLVDGRLELNSADGASYAPRLVGRRDLALRFTLMFVGGSGSAGAGVTFGFDRWGENQYFLLLDASQNRAFRMGYIDSVWQPLIPWTNSSAIQRARNEVELILSGGAATVLINGVQVGRADLGSGIEAGILAAMVGGGPSTYAFDDFIAIGLTR